MAEGVVSFLLQNLKELIEGEAKLLKGVSGQVKLLCNELEWIRFFITDADQKSRQYERVKIWLSQIRDAAYDVEDVIDTFIVNVERRRQESIARRFISLPSHISAIHKLGTQIQELQVRLEKISAYNKNYQLEQYLQPGEDPSNEGTLASKGKRASRLEASDDWLFEDHANTLAKKLRGEEEQRTVISIVGMGGLGKSTLARKLYNRDDIMRHFPISAWIDVSQEYKARDLLLKAIEDVKGLSEEDVKKLPSKKDDELETELRDYLKEKRYLVVLDDVWRKEDWDKLSPFLPNVVGNGSRVLLTTRHKDVASHAQSTEIYELHPLDKEQSWELFSKKVSCPEDTKDVGEQIVAKCGGLPLAIVVLAVLLSEKEKTRDAWSKVLKSVNWQLHQGPQNCLEVFALSYNNLPYYLKPCLLYLALFPEDYSINAGRLIRLWIAEGFIQQRGEETMEEVGEDYMEELIHRNMIQVEERRTNGEVKSCSIHDLLREFAISQGKQSNFLEVYGESYSSLSSSSIAINRPSRRLALHPVSDKHNTCTQHYSTHNIRSFLSFREEKNHLDDLWKSFRHREESIKLLRVLDLQDASICELPKEIGNLNLLKYLAICVTEPSGGLEFRTYRIPPSIGNLRNLQTLVVKSSNYNYLPMPNTIWKLHQLRHLKIPKAIFNEWTIGNPCVHHPHPPTINRLKNLQTLELREGSWIEGGLDELVNLRKLKIEGESLGNLYTQTLSDSLVKMSNLRSLELSDLDKNRTKQPLPFVQFSKHTHLYKLVLNGKLKKLPVLPPNLTELYLMRSCLNQQAGDGSSTMQMLEKLPKLRLLSLEYNAYKGKEMICSKEGFPKLEELTLYHLEELEEWIMEEGAMPSLQVLEIVNCKQLETLPNGLRHIPTLKDLLIRDMPEEFNDMVREDTGEDWYKIKHIASIAIV